MQTHLILFCDHCWAPNRFEAKVEPSLLWFDFMACGYCRKVSPVTEEIRQAVREGVK